MKSFITFNILVTFLFFSCVQESSNPLVGTWELVEGEYKTEDTSLKYPITCYSKHMKIFTPTHFVTVRQDTTRPDQSYQGFNGGTYTLADSLYAEYHDYFSNPSAIGGKVFFKIKFEGDTLYFSSVTEDGKDQEFGFFEEWKKIE